MSEPTREQIARTIDLAMHRVWYPEEEHDGSEPLEAHFEAADDVLALFRAPASEPPKPTREAVKQMIRCAIGDWPSETNFGVAADAVLALWKP